MSYDSEGDRTHRDHEPEAHEDHGRAAPGPDASHAESRRQRQAGHEELTGRIIARNIEGGQSQISIGRGSEDGIVVGTKGHIKTANGGVLAEFTVHEVYGPHRCRAFVHATLDQIDGAGKGHGHEHGDVYVAFHPAAKAQAKHGPKGPLSNRHDHTERWGADDNRQTFKEAKDTPGRVIARDIENGMSRIWVGRGWEDGVFQGTRGYIKDGHGGVLAEFTVHEVYGPHRCRAYVDATLDQIDGAGKGKAQERGDVWVVFAPSDGKMSHDPEPPRQRASKH
ncbi:MAG TPA: hypothetical protein VKE22_25610 [Haliangiales bacterium]|nr:hypothetical protein [Haliangiales bacterium]